MSFFNSRPLLGSGTPFYSISELRADDTTETYQESSVVRLEWTIRDLKQLFDNSKGDGKSKVLKSVKFGGGRWQILFYPNAGTEGGQYVSLYLSCEPTPEEKEAVANGRWVRDGQYKFSFELKNLSKTMLFSQKEANDHCFSWKTANWGWAQFARRDNVYYQQNVVRQQDAFLIICVISSSPAAPVLAPSIPCRSVPRQLLDVIGTLLDDPTYSDVEFVLPKRGKRHRTRRLYAAKAVIKRAEYFDSMFGSGFAESSEPLEFPSSQPDADLSAIDNEQEPPELRQYEDSDMEDEEMTPENDDELDKERPPELDSCDVEHLADGRRNIATSVTVRVDDMSEDESRAETPILVLPEDSITNSANQSDAEDNALRNVRAKVKHPSSPRQNSMGGDYLSTSDQTDPGLLEMKQYGSRGPSKVKVVVKDVAYSTYRAVLYYLYTDSIKFAPLASSFFFKGTSSGAMSASPAPVKPQEEGQNLNPPVSSFIRPPIHAERSATGPINRREWIRDWEHQNPGKERPCSAKAVYRIADKLNLEDLKNRAFKHIVKSLTIDNVPYEMFSNFSATFEEVRKTQIAFFLEHWNDIRSSESMKTIWQQIRVGRHPGFEEVWPLIAMNLEFKPRNVDATTGDNRENNGAEI